MQAISDEKLSQWQLLIEEREKNNLTIAEFYRQKNITASRYYYYQDLIKNPDEAKQKKQKDKLHKKSELQPIKVINTFSQTDQI